ncbi:MAG: PAS domain S-box protein, partial [FCB group bacterium]|nr:PAS domain S-box protein [FCB group bacterium]
MDAEKISLKLYSRNRQALIEAAVSQTNDGIAIADLEGNLLFINEAFAEMHGYEIDELDGKNLTIFHTPDQLESVRQANEKILNDGYFKGEIWHVHKNGNVFPTLMNNSLMIDEDNKPIGMIGTAADISEAKINQQKLLESEERFRSLYENATIGIYRTTPEGEILLANPALVEMLGYGSFEELRKRNLETNGFQYDYPRMNFREMLEEKGVVRGLESAWIKKNNDIVYVRESARIIFSDTGIPRYYEGVVEDISSRKVAESLLMESEKKYRLIAQNARDVIFTADLNLKLDYISPSVEILTGYTDDEIKNVPVTKLVPSRTLKVIYQVMRKFRNAVGDAPGDRIFEQKELEILRKDGSAIWAEIIGSAVWDENGKFLCINGVARDITKRKNAELALHRSEAIL